MAHKEQLAAFPLRTTAWRKNALDAHLMGTASPRTGAPSMISYLASVSVSLCAPAPVPVVSRRRISSSMCFNLMRTCRGKTGVPLIYI